MNRVTHCWREERAPMHQPSANAELTGPIQDDDHIAGPNTAAITIVSCCDFECAYCRCAYPSIKRLQVRLSDRMRVVFRHFPLVHKHSLAQQAAEATEAAH